MIVLKHTFNIAWCLALGLEERRGLKRGFPMKKDIHPKYEEITASCLAVT